MIESFTFSEFKSIQAGTTWTDVPMFAVLTGPNGSGKTNVLEAIQHMQTQTTPAGVLGVPGRRNRQHQSKSLSLGPSLTGASHPKLTAELQEILNKLGVDFRNARVAQLDNQGPTEPPWIEVNETLASLGVPYALTTAEHLTVREIATTGSFVPQLQHLPDRGRAFSANDLSPGERAIILVTLWAYTVPRQSELPVLLLLDEPDASMHTSVIGVFLKVLREKLVRDKSVQVIMSTHRPDTIALCPPGSLFDVRANPRTTISPTTQRASIGRLSSYLFTAAPFRCVFVEGADDPAFYGAFYAATKRRPDLPELTFVLPHGPGGSGGDTLVRNWVRRLRKASPLVHGIVDRDHGASPEPGIHVIGRYSIENYLRDPILVYAMLVECGKAPPVAPPLSIDIKRGGSRTLATLGADELQRVADVVIGQVEQQLSDLQPNERERVEVPFLGGTILRYPKWLLYRRGKSLSGPFRAALGDGYESGVRNGLDAFACLEMVPTDLANLFEQVATDIS